MDKSKIFSTVKNSLDKEGLGVQSIDMTRPWGGFFVINEADSEKFIDQYFPALDKTQLLHGKLSPKILLVQPGKKLSWQYHHRRSEIWKLIEGHAAVATSDTDTENDIRYLQLGETITLKQGERHRLIGLDDWGIVAEIWVHTDVNNPSNEDDIVRLQDDFGR